MLLRTRVSSDLHDLQRLHEATGWTPSADQIRPTAAVRAQKELLLSNLGAMWASPMDWVFHHVFGSPTTRDVGSGKRSGFGLVQGHRAALPGYH